jgi:hypothetical protein
LANGASLNTEFIKFKIPQVDCLLKLKAIAISELKVVLKIHHIKKRRNNRILKSIQENLNGSDFNKILSTIT